MSIDSGPRQPKGIPGGGQFASMSHLESGVTLADPERKNQRFAERREYLRRSGFVPAAILDAATAPATTALREEWWDRSRVPAEYGAYPPMPYGPLVVIPTTA